MYINYIFLIKMSENKKKVFFSVYSEINRNSIEIGLFAYFFQAVKVCEVLFWYKPNY